MSEQGKFGLKHRQQPSTEKDIYLIHNSADKPWVQMLAERIEDQAYGTRNLAVVFDKWDFPKGSNLVLEMEQFLDSARFFGLVVSKAMLNAEWPTMERTAAVWADPSGARGKVITLLRENVTLPATLRMRNWIDFRDDNSFAESFGELIRCLRGETTLRGRGSFLPKVSVTPPPYEPAPVQITSSIGADRVREKLVANLYRVTAIPEKVYYASTKLRQKKDIHEYCAKAPPFILREGKLYTFVDLSTNEDFRSVLTKPETPICSDTFADWFSDEEYRRRAIELLNVCFKQHAWNLHLRFDGSRARYFSAPTGPKSNKPRRIAWRIGGIRRWREVTTRHTRMVKQEDGSFKKEPFGWRHQGIRASFMYVMNNLMLKLEPTYLLTRDDGKTPRTSRWVGPICPIG